MTFLRNVWADLIDKRLWPLALVLVLALVAVPTLLAKQATDEPAGPDPVGAAATAQTAGNADGAVITLNTVSGGGPEHGATGRNPFKQLFVPKAKPAGSDAAASADSGNPGKAGGDSGGDTSTGESNSGSSAPKKTETKTTTTYKVNLRFGQAGAMKTIDDIARLTPLPSAANPFFVFLGVKGDGDTLVFLVSSDAKATGDGTCKPKPSQCETIEMKAGDTEFFDLSTDAGVQQYQLDIVSVKKVTTASAAAAASANARVSPAGARLLKDAGSDGVVLGAYRWSAGQGLLFSAAG